MNAEKQPGNPGDALDRLARIRAAAEPVREWRERLRKIPMGIAVRMFLKNGVDVLLAAIDGKAEEGDVDAETGTADDRLSPEFVAAIDQVVDALIADGNKIDPKPFERGHGSGPLPGKYWPDCGVVQTPEKTLFVRKAEEE